MERIAAEAGISKQTLYNRYPDKQSLFFAVLAEYTHRVTLGATTLPSSVKTIEELTSQLHMFGLAVVKTMGNPQYLGFMRAILPEMPRQPELQKIFSTNMPERIIGSITTLIDLAQQSGIVRPVQSDIVARMFAGSLLTYILQRGVLGRQDVILSEGEMATLAGQFAELIKAT